MFKGGRTKHSHIKILLVVFFVAFLLRFGFTHFFPQQETLSAVLSYALFSAMLVYSFVKGNESKVNSRKLIVLLFIIACLVLLPLVFKIFV